MQVRVLNGAVRASGADFAALCWDEIWSSHHSPREGNGDRGPQFDLILLDYTYTSSPSQQRALVDRARPPRSRTLPVFATSCLLLADGFSTYCLLLGALFVATTRCGRKRLLCTSAVAQDDADKECRPESSLVCTEYCVLRTFPLMPSSEQ